MTTSVAPYISLQSSGTMVTIQGTSASKNLQKYELFADFFAFDNWRDWVNDSANTPTQIQKDNASKYTNYVIKFYCQLEKQYNVCGL